MMRRESLVCWLQLVVLMSLATPISAHAQARSGAKEPRPEQNKALVRRWIEEGLNQRTLPVVDELFVERFAVNGHVIGRDGVKQSMSRHLLGFPDLHVTIDEIVAEGDKVALWYTVEGTQGGEFEGVAATDKHVRWSGADFFTVEEGRISEARFVSDLLGLLKQLGAARPQQGPGLEGDQAAILEVIEGQAAAFWAKDFERWADTWVHAPYVRRLGWSEAGGVSSVEGWEAIGGRMKESMANNPNPNPTPAKLAREHLNFRIYGDAAWVTFDQRGVSTGEPRFDMPGLSHETRILEKHDGKWRVAYLGYLLAGNPEARPAR